MSKKKVTPLDKVAPITWEKIGAWLADRIAEMEPDAASIRAEEGREFLPALRGLAEHLRAGKGPDSGAQSGSRG